MKTVINAQGCNTFGGTPGLHVEGELVVNGVDVVKHLTAPKEEVAASCKKCDTCAAVEEKCKKLEASLVDNEKDLKVLEEKLKSLEASFKKTKKAPDPE